jgi:pyruvate formate lyase activating enzyme
MAAAEQKKPFGVIFNIQKYSVNDGPGIRTTVFFKGCPLRCWWCHNPEGLETAGQIVIYENRCRNCGHCRAVCPYSDQWDTAINRPTTCNVCGACVKACPSGARQQIGRTISVEEVMREIRKDRLFYDDSGGGVTFSGGEPFAQPVFLLALLDSCRNESIHTAVDTSGFCSPSDLHKAAKHTDLFLYDLKLMDDQRHSYYTGQSNRTILENLKSLSAVHSNIWLRIPIVPGITDDDANIDAIAELAVTLPSVRQIHLLPYHNTASAKLNRLGRSNPLENLSAPDSRCLERLRDRIADRGLTVKIGG